MTKNDKKHVKKNIAVLTISDKKHYNKNNAVLMERRKAHCAFAFFQRRFLLIFFSINVLEKHISSLIRYL